LKSAITAITDAGSAGITMLDVVCSAMGSVHLRDGCCLASVSDRVARARPL
jgi:hypothetical protein